MTIPLFTLTGKVSVLTGGASVPVRDLVLRFVCNIRSGDVVNLDNASQLVGRQDVRLDADGKINGSAGVKLLANDPALGLARPLQWTVSTSYQPQLGQVYRAWTFTAPAAGQTVDLSTLAPVAGTVARGAFPFTKWAEIPDKPAAFPPSAHTHVLADIPSLPTVAKTGAYADLTGKPTTFPPAFHTHPVTEVTGLAAVATSGAYADLVAKPATFPPSVHTHTASQVSDSTAVGRGVLTAADAAAARTVTGAASQSDMTAAQATISVLSQMLNGIRVHTTVTVDRTKVGAALTGFPLFVDLADMPAKFWARMAATNGGDIRCFGPTGVELAREVVSCNPVAKTGELHVKCDLSATMDTPIVITVDGYSADYAVTAPFGARAVWSEYSVVSHDGGITNTLGNAPDLSAWVQDVGSSPVTYTLTPNSNSMPTLTAGLLGASGGSYFTAGDTALRYAKTAKGVAQISVWAKPDNVSAGRQIVDLRQIDANRQLMVPAASSFGGNLLVDNTYLTGGRNNYLNGVLLSAATALTISQWNYIVTQAGTATVTPVEMTLGQSLFNTGGNYIGLLDEIRACDVARSTAWIAAEYANQNNRASFYRVA